ncbi:coiled-coil domain-containing protein 22 homolog [Diachasma alloeum]|uniref:coiled-coil domain-containing protein 22 homolog n=1 Tax=Diachasma alloeum TaxID=454923 RepID=UPI000738341E|nr:coiled-coil domain-containing protein 22 homolog [Diachasma alloeum]
MEEVDNIIIHSLRQIGCDIDENVTNLGGFDTDLVVEATVRCLDVIKPGLGTSRVLPANMAARFRVGASLAQACSELGYRGDIGYQTFLYSSETDLRRVLMFLTEKLPKETDKASTEPTSKLDKLEKTVASVLQKQLSTPWLPHYCHRSRTDGHTSMPYRAVDLDLPPDNPDPEYQDYHGTYQPSVPELVDQECLIPSIVSRTSKLLYSRPTNIIERLEWLHKFPATTESTSEERISSRFTLNERLQLQTSRRRDEPEEVERSPESASTPSEPSAPSREERQMREVEGMKADCESLRVEVEAMTNELGKLDTQLSQVRTKRQEEERELEVREEQRRIKARTYDLLEDGDNNVVKLEGVIEAGRNKLIHLANQWEKHRAPLIKQYRDEREKYSAKTSTSQKKLDELRILRERERELMEECHMKDQQYAQLVAEVQKLPKDVNRSAYTQRILEIINNVRKQRDEIDKVLGDTREIQKEINTLSGRLERSFTVVDELIFRDAKGNEASRRAYKLLATLHSDCSELVNLVEETGTTLREIRDLEEQIDSESTKNVGANLERITADLKQMRQETASLTAQLASKNS